MIEAVDTAVIAVETIKGDI